LNIWSIFRERGFFQQATDEAGLQAAGEAAPLTGYIGFDPTADSFHVGHLIPLMALVHFQRAGHRPIALLGAGTAMIGDPTGKNEMRQMLSVEELDRNVQGLQRQLAVLLDFEAGAILANNADWLRGLGYIDFLREIGPQFSVNRMLTFETFRTRLEGAGLSFLEFNYPLLQSYDFLELHRRHGCVLQMGGDDQWANIISGVDLVRRLARATVYGWTFPLHTTASGAKMGKTERGAVWLDTDRTSPYDYYQYWINVEDADVGKCLRLFTLLEAEEIRGLEKLRGAELRRAKQVLAFETTRLIHGEEEAKRAEQGARALFGGQGGSLEDVPTSTLAPGRIAEGLAVSEILAEVGLARSRSEARRLIQQGGVTVNDERVTALDFALSPAHVAEGAILLRVGKKKYHRLVVE
jgi:tyrosyl-tRNA synthetase